MKRRLIGLLTVVALTAGISAVNGQDETQPLSPVLDRVSVDPLTGYALISWMPSSSPDVGSYVVYTYSGNTAYAVDTVMSPFITTYTHTLSAARYESVTYVVAAIDSSLNISPLSNSLSTVYLSLENDTCNSRLILTWTPYANQLHPATGYAVMMSENGSAPVAVGSLPLTQLSFPYSDYSPSVQYCFYVTPANGATALASSNRKCALTGTQIPPEWIAADAASVESGNIVIRGRFDSRTTLKTFAAEKYDPSTSQWIIRKTGPGAGGSIETSLTAEDTTVIRLFRISARNNCGQNIISSEPVRNIVLSAEADQDVISLSWNNPFPGLEADFELWRDAGSGFSVIAGPFSDTAFTDSFSSFPGLVSSQYVTYLVTAADPSGPEGLPRVRSNAAVIKTEENILVANAFTPDGNGVNDLFLPAMSFTPSEYSFAVYTRNGVLLFSTTDPGQGWDGRHGGETMPPGVYLWSLTVKAPSGNVSTRTGTVTILP